MARVTKSQVTGDFGENYVRNVVETGWGCFFRSSGDRDRHGIDGTVTDVVNGKVQPLQFHVQVKAGNFKNKPKTNEFRAPVRSRDVDFWRRLNVPVVLICIDTNHPTTAYWHIIHPNASLPVNMSRRKEFNPGSRDAVVGAIRKALGSYAQIALYGKTLTVPLNLGVRKLAKAYYRALKADTCVHPIYGPISFTWKGWRHLTRKKRSIRKITQALLLLPSLPGILSSASQPVDSRELKPIRRGNLIFSRTLLVFEPMIRLTHRADLRARVVIERDTIFPGDWATSHPRDPRRQQFCRFYSLSELSTAHNEIIAYGRELSPSFGEHIRLHYSLI